MMPLIFFHHSFISADKVTAFPSFQLLDTGKIHILNDLFQPIHNYRAVDEALLSSIKAFGILQPLLVQQEKAKGNERFALLSGFNRLQAALQLKIQSIPCLVLSAEALPAYFFQLIAEHKHLDHHVSPIEDALLLRNAQGLVNEQESYSLLKIMGYKPQKHHLDELLSLLKLEKSAIINIHKGNVARKSAKNLLKLSHEDQRLVVALIDKYRFGGSKQQNFVQMAVELTKRRSCSMAEILNTWNQEQISDSKNIPQQGGSLLTFLQDQCTPEFTAAEKTYQQRIHKLQLPDHFHLHHSLSFEKDSCQLSITFANMDFLEDSLPSLKAMIPSPATRETA